MGNNNLSKEIQIILNCDKGIDYSNKVHVTQIHNAITNNNSLNSTVGKKYTNKLKSIIDGTSSNNCFLCGISSPKVICPSCHDLLLSKMQAQTANASVQSAPSHTLSPERKPIENYPAFQQIQAPQVISESSKQDREPQALNTIQQFYRQPQIQSNNQIIDNNNNVKPSQRPLNTEKKAKKIYGKLLAYFLFDGVCIALGGVVFFIVFIVSLFTDKPIGGSSVGSKLATNGFRIEYLIYFLILAVVASAVIILPTYLIKKRSPEGTFWKNWFGALWLGAKITFKISLCLMIVFIPLALRIMTECYYTGYDAFGNEIWLKHIKDNIYEDASGKRYIMH